MEAHVSDLTNVELAKNAALSGVAGGAVMTGLIAMGQKIGMTSMDMPMMLGSAVTERKDIQTKGIGLGMHMAASAGIGLAYGAGFRLFDVSGPKAGALFGIIHWMIAGTVIGLAPKKHPMMPGRIKPPGFFALNRGITDSIGFFMGHVIYGAIHGLVFRKQNAH